VVAIALSFLTLATNNPTVFIAVGTLLVYNLVRGWLR
jgi:hypothetical protein